MIEEQNLIAFSNPKSPVSEAYRVLRTNIQFSSYDKQLKTIITTSSGPGEGKSTTICNLAVTMAQSGSKVLLIDTDLRKPKIHKVFGLDNKKGITTLLSKHGSIADYIEKVGIDNLDILKCGPIPPNPSELLGSNSMKSFIEGIKDSYDVILLDTPPVGTVTDAAVLSTIADGVILVINSGKVDIEAARRAKELLQKVNANILGVVLNKMSKQNQGSYYNYYYYAQDENGSNRKRRKKREKAVRECTN